MQNQTSNMVYVVSLGTEVQEWSAPFTPVEIVVKKDKYFHPVGNGYPKEPPNYLGFRWHGKLQQIRHIDDYVISTGETHSVREFCELAFGHVGLNWEDHVITDPREADVGSILGFGFAPFTGGTLSYIDFMGTKKFVELCHKFEAKYGSRFTPPKLLEDMAAKGETFYGRFPPKKLAAA